MAKPSHREKILTEGLRVVHAHGFANASVRDIVQAAGVPQGSFTNHFVSKEAFGLEVIDLYFSRSDAVIRNTLRNDALPPLQRLADYIETSRNRLNQDNMRNGCMLGNFTAEATDHSEPIRDKLLRIFDNIRDAITYCLEAAVKAGELRADFECEEVAAFIVSSLQGANLLAKAERNPAPVDRFKRILFTTILR
ncbi:TetR/AcrR family transcriptional regulator [Rhizobium tubonense]|uniref:TetR family transcriptional regulator n=1 Tax=Rhizobium tubonense TaxID=484088 RepID=A0A2W4CV15_9HYPH|nr:TetR/AcrR family transcriptional regulator [Rhizobium tubonense]PZM16179.1 TetR family transcriptional regulator [Rhizobium tubonense]